MKTLIALLSLVALVSLAAVGTAAARNGADDPAATARAADDHGGGRGGRDDDGDEDVRGNCDEAEHANDAACKGTAAASKTAKTVGAGTRLVAIVGPGFTIALRTPAGAAVRTAKPGAYTITVRDRSGDHNFHLSGPGVNKETSESGTATATWRVTLRRGAYRFVCDPHAAVMKGSLRVA
jgi:plastocyanin